MSSTHRQIRKILSRRGVHDPVGVKEALRTGKVKDLIMKELVAAGLDDASIKEALSVEFLAQLSREADSKLDIIDKIENTLDLFVYEPLYQREFGSNLDAKLQEKMDSLGVNIAKTQLVEDALKLPKVTIGVMGAVASVWAMSLMSHGISIKSIFHTALAHDLWCMSYNCYRKTYILKAVRMLHIENGIAGTIYNAVSSAITGRESENTKYLREVNTDVVFQGTCFDCVRRWVYQFYPEFSAGGSKSKSD